MKKISLLLALAALTGTSPAADKPYYFPVCRPASFGHGGVDHCMPTTVLFKSANMDAGQKFLVPGIQPDPEKLPYYDADMDVLLYYRVGDKLGTRNRHGEEEWRFNYAGAVFWCLRPGSNRPETPKPVACGAVHGYWPQRYQGRGTGGMEPGAVSQQIMRAVMPLVVEDLPVPPPEGPWRSFEIGKVTVGKSPGPICKAGVLQSEKTKKQIVTVMGLELRGIALPRNGNPDASLTLCDGETIVVETRSPAVKAVCKLEPPYDLSTIDTVAGNCAKEIGQHLSSFTR